jgi:hypothetical protein
VSGSSRCVAGRGVGEAGGSRAEQSGGRSSGVKVPVIDGITPRNTQIGEVRLPGDRGSRDNGRGTFEVGERRFLSVQPTTALVGDDARVFAWGTGRIGSLRPSPHIFYDPFDMPEWFYFSWYELDIYALLAQHGVIDPAEWDTTNLLRSWGNKF